MRFTQILYLASISISLVLSIWCYKGEKSLKVFPYLLSLSLVTEIIVDICYFILDIDYHVFYHIYTPLEYFLFALYFYIYHKSKIAKTLIVVSIIIFTLLSIFISNEIININVHPGLNDNVEGFFLIILSSFTLLTINFNPKISIMNLPVFWICLAILIFHSGVFLFNGLYNYLVTKKSEIAQPLHQIIIKNFNYLLYILFSIAFICSNRMKKYTLQ
jgi:hypothetical protein